MASTLGQMANHGLGHDYVFGLVPLFNLDHEQNLPTLFSAFLLATAAFLLALIATLRKNGDNSDASSWAGLPFGFALMAIDEAWAFHERLSGPLRGLFGSGLTPPLHFAWVIPALLVVVAVAVSFLGFLRRLDARTRGCL